MKNILLFLPPSVPSPSHVLIPSSEGNNPEVTVNVYSIIEKLDPGPQ
jgi:hypothetical protein